MESERQCWEIMGKNRISRGIIRRREVGKVEDNDVIHRTRGVGGLLKTRETQKGPVGQKCHSCQGGSSCYGADGTLAEKGRGSIDTESTERHNPGTWTEPVVFDARAGGRQY